MASDASISSKHPVVALLRKGLPDSSLLSSSADRFSPADLTKAASPQTTYSDTDLAAVQTWLAFSEHLGEDTQKLASQLTELNTHLASRTTVLGAKASVADLALFAQLAPLVKRWSDEERTGINGYHHIVRFVDFVQNSDNYHIKIPDEDRVSVDPDVVKEYIKPIDPKVEKERRKKEKEEAMKAAAVNGTENAQTSLPIGQGPPGNAGGRKAKKEAKAAAKGESGETTTTGKTETASAGTGSAQATGQKDHTSNNTQTTPGAAAQTQGKKEKPPKQKKPQPAAAPEKPLSPSLIDLRVGHILKAERHPNADSLYVSTVAVGDAPGTENTSEYEGQVVRTVCSGLNGLIPLEEMQNRKIVAVCNLKPVTMRGIKSCAMVLAASPRVPEGGDPHAGPVELVNPPSDAAAGTRIAFEGWEGEPEAVLNPKKKVWDMCQVGFTTTSAREVAFEKGAVEQLKDAQHGGGAVSLLKCKGETCTVKSLEGATVR